MTASPFVHSECPTLFCPDLLHLRINMPGLISSKTHFVTQVRTQDKIKADKSIPVS